MRRPLRFGTVGLIVAVGCALGPAAASGAAPGAAHQFFRNCAEAADAGIFDIPQGAPAYSTHLDRDRDGIACEQGGETVTALPPEPGQQANPPTTAPAGQAAPGEQLPVTGASTATTVALVLAAILLFVGGAHLLRVGYEHQRWLHGRRRAEVRYTIDRRSRLR